MGLVSKSNGEEEEDCADLGDSVDGVTGHHQSSAVGAYQHPREDFTQNSRHMQTFKNFAKQLRPDEDEEELEEKMDLQCASIGYTWATD